MSKSVRFLFWTIVAIYGGVLASDLYSGYDGGAILMFISICGLSAIRLASGWGGWGQTGEGQGP